MTILEVRIRAGQEDKSLLIHISRLEVIKARLDGGCGISEREEVTLAILYDRLDKITSPDFKG